MIKIIIGRSGEGKTRECIREIERLPEGQHIVVLSEDGDFRDKLSLFSKQDSLRYEQMDIFSGRDVLILDVLRGLPESVDTVVWDTVRNIDMSLSPIAEFADKYNFIITQQMRRIYE